MATKTEAEGVMSHAERVRPIGGFLSLELPGGDAGLRRLWGLRDDRLAFVNASSALANLISAIQDGAVWLPAYICPEFTLAIPIHRLHYYPLDTNLSPNIQFLADMVRAGDLVVGVNFFGRPPSQSFITYAAERRDVLFVEDCAQTIDTGEPPWGDWRLFSPRKVVGVPDGGILVECSARASAVRPTGSVDGDLPPIDLAIPQLLRFEDPDESHNDIWFQLNRAKEDGLSISSRRISRLAWAILGLLDADTIARRRRRNFRHLASRLGPWAFLAETHPRFVPVGFPVRLPSDEREKVRQYLHRQRVLPAVHWSNLPSPPHEFADEHALASTLLTLPCDQRYGAPEMERVADLFINAVAC